MKDEAAGGDWRLWGSRVRQNAGESHRVAALAKTPLRWAIVARLSESRDGGRPPVGAPSSLLSTFYVSLSRRAAALGDLATTHNGGERKNPGGGPGFFGIVSEW